MAKNLYITSTEARSGKSAIALGVMELLLRNTDKVVFFRPIVNIARKGNKHDKDIQLIASHFQLPIEHDDMYAYTFQEASEIITTYGLDRLLEGILEKYKLLEGRFNFVLCEGTDFESPDPAFELDINFEIANNLGSPVLLIVNAHEKTLEEIVNSTKVMMNEFQQRGCEMVATIINRAQVQDTDEFKQVLKENIPDGKRMVYVVSENPHLSKPSMGEIASWLNAEVLYGEAHLNRLVYHYTIAGMRIKSFLNQIKDRSLVIVPGDREDIILCSLLSLQSSYFPNIAGILLTENIIPDETLWRLIKGLSDIPIPILRVREDTFQAATKVSTTYAGITPDNTRNIATVLKVFETHVDIEELGKKIEITRPTRITPKMFEYGLIQKARSNKKHIVLPEGPEERILRAAEILLRREVVDITLLGNEEEIGAKIKKLGLRMENAHIVNPIQSPRFEDYVQTYFELRKHKGITLENARDVMTDKSYFGTMMVYKKHADGMVSGSINTTSHTIRPAFEFIRTKPEFSIISSVFFMCLQDRVLVYGDCAINPNPTAEQLADIAIASADTAKAFGIEPIVAMLSYSTGTSGQGAEVEKVLKATQLARQKRPGLKIDGPLQYDAAIDTGVAKTKLPQSEVAGKATVFIFPDLNTGNNTYKAVQRSAGAVAVGPVLQGLKKPVNDLSRGCTVPDIVNTVAITAIQAQMVEGT